MFDDADYGELLAVLESLRPASRPAPTGRRPADDDDAWPIEDCPHCSGPLTHAGRCKCCGRYA